MTTAAFFRLEGPLVRRGAAGTAAWFAANGAGLRERAFRLGQVAIAAPVVGWLRGQDAKLATRVSWAACRGMSRDRVELLAEEYVDEILDRSVLASGEDLLRRARRDGRRIVLLSENIRPVVEPLVDRWRIVDDWVCNRLEYRDDEATGRLIDPVIGGHDTAGWIRAYAETHGIDLGRSVVYASRGGDMLSLALAGEACAVNPDFTLRRAAVDAGWPVLDYAA